MTTAHNSHSSTPLAFLTLTTGHVVPSPRSEVGDHVINALRPIVRSGRGEIGGWEIRMTAGNAGGGAAFELRRRGRWLTSGYVAWTEEGAAEMWKAAEVHRTSLSIADARSVPPSLPWLAVAMMPGVLDPRDLAMAIDNVSAMAEAADLERCIAWTLISIAREHADTSKATAKSEVRPSPTDGIPAGGDDIRLRIGPEGIALTVQWREFEQIEVDTLRRGRLDIGVLSSGATGFLLLRFHFADGRRPTVMEAPFHYGTLPPGLRYLKERPEGLVHTLAITLYDGSGHQRGGRIVGISEANCEAIERLVRRQAEEASRPGWSPAQHEREVRQFYERFPDPERIVDRLFERAHGRQTVH